MQTIHEDSKNMIEKDNSPDGNIKEASYYYQWPFYDPPYDSPIEDEFAYNIVKYLDKGIELVKQFEIETFCAKYRLDFLLTHNGRNVGIECDGAVYHDRDKDRIRDTLILGSKTVDRIFRINGRNINNNINDCIWLIAQYEPLFFSIRGRANLDLLSSETTRNTEILYEPFVLIKHEPKDDDDKYWEVFLEIRNFSSTNYYFYMFKEYWEIIKYYHLTKIEQIEKYFKDIPAVIDVHYKMLNSFNNRQIAAYRCLMEDIQNILYGGNKLP